MILVNSLYKRSQTSELNLMQLNQLSTSTTSQQDPIHLPESLSPSLKLYRRKQWGSLYRVPRQNCVRPIRYQPVLSRNVWMMNGIINYDQPLSWNWSIPRHLERCTCQTQTKKTGTWTCKTDPTHEQSPFLIQGNGESGGLASCQACHNQWTFT